MVKRRYETIQKGKSGIGGLSIAFVLVIAVVTVGCVGAVFAMTSTINMVEESRGVVLQINVYGNDIVVTVLKGENIDKLRYILLIIDNVELSEKDAMKKFSGKDDKIVYESVAKNLKGNHMIGVRGYFSDGTSAMIDHKELRFS